MLIIEKILLLKNSDIFKNCSEVDLIEIASICEEEHVDKMTTIFKKGDAGNCMYFIYSGSVSVHDAEHQLAVLNENEIFGDIYYDADFLEPKEVVYAYLAGDGSLTITDDLNTFDEGYKTEKDWKITKFTEI
jgi:signal-transduction protein with cAMP-binding, CBS, and nucleotidyltransferase domain